MMTGIAVPAVGLAVVGWFVPVIWARILGEGVGRLVLNGLLSAMTMSVIGGLFFVGLYLVMGYPVAELFGAGVGPVIGHFGPLAVRSALLWGPVMILSVANLPRRWKTAVW